VKPVTFSVCVSPMNCRCTPSLFSLDLKLDTLPVIIGWIIENPIFFYPGFRLQRKSFRGLLSRIVWQLLSVTSHRYLATLVGGLFSVLCRINKAVGCASCKLWGKIMSIYFQQVQMLWFCKNMLNSLLYSKLKSCRSTGSAERGISDIIGWLHRKSFRL